MNINEEQEIEDIKKAVEEAEMISEREWEDNEDEVDTVLDKAREEKKEHEEFEKHINSLDIKPFKNTIYDIKTFCDDMCMFITDEAHDVVLDKEPAFGFGFKVNGIIRWIYFVDYNGAFHPFYNDLYLMDDYNDWMASPKVENILKKHLPFMNISYNVILKDYDKGEDGRVDIEMKLKDKKLYPYIEKRKNELIEGKDTIGVDSTKSYEIDMLWDEYKHQKELAEKYRKDSDWNKIDGRGMDDDFVTENNEEETEDISTDNTEDSENEGFKTIDEFLKGTDTKVNIKLEGCEPSPIFGPNDKRNHNKYRITLTNPKGRMSFVFWDSIANTEEGKELDIADAMYSVAMDAQAYGQSLSFEDFKSSFGYDETNSDLAQKAYNGCKKHMEKLNKLYTPEELDQLYKITSEM